MMGYCCGTCNPLVSREWDGVKIFLVNALLQKSKSESFIMDIGGETYMKIGLIEYERDFRTGERR